MSRYFSARNLLFAIIIIAFLFRIWNVGNQDLFGDEAPDAFRAIGYLDYLGSSFQTQPIDWYKNQSLPWWTSLSFHDFPPLAMIIQNVFFRVFGDSLLTARLPAVALGTISVFLIYLIAKELFAMEALALFSALLFAINSATVWIFRTSLLEPILLFFIVLNIYFFFKFFKNNRYWWYFGVTLGLVVLTKYTGVFLAPVYIFYLIFISILRRREFSGNNYSPGLLENWRFYAAFGLALLLFMPVIIYNIFLYKTTGHFDLQAAYLLKQNTPEWTGLVGKVQSPFSEIWQNLIFHRIDPWSKLSYPAGYYGALAILAVFMGIIFSAFKFLRFSFIRSGILFFWLYLVFVTLLLVKIGSAHRFLTLYGPAFAIFTGLILNGLWNSAKLRRGYVGRMFVIGFFAFEIFHSINANFFQFPDYGLAKLDNFLEKEFIGKESAVIPESDNPHLNKVIYKFALQRPKQAGRAFRLIVYNDNIALPTLEWIFYRRFFYHSIPTLFVENFSKSISVQGEEYFKPFAIYFVQSTENTLLNNFKRDKTAGADFEKLLQSRGYSPIKTIYGHDNLPMFRIYRFSV